MLRTKVGELTLAAWAYMLRCADGSYYVGCTTDLDGRMGHHIAGTLGGYTSTRRPVEMVWAEEFQTIHDAIDAERRVKGWTRAKKEALIAGDWARIVRLGSRSKGAASFETRPASPAAPQDDEGGGDGSGKLKGNRRTRQAASFETRPASPAAPQDDERGDDGVG